MLENSEILSVFFVIFTTVWAWWFSKSVGLKKPGYLILVGWLVFIALLGFAGFFTIADTMPPRLAVALGPPLIFSIIYPYTPGGRRFTARINLESLTLIHTGRILVEAVFFLSLANMGWVSDVITFHGRNFDIIPGVTSLLIWWLFFQKKILSKELFLMWNIASLLVLLFTISQVWLTAPFVFQMFSFDQPTVALFYFPFVWIASFLAPLMIFSHIVVFHRYKANTLRLGDVSERLTEKN